ncbi:MAG: M20/M25/M40 family metallo-hydrolase, partial [Planctomycetota bacterium]|nr:M20/M25/M40 family metallo-hydrolase [Planctomycetota bacterium]
YARSAGDDKAPLMALMIAFKALRDAGIPITSNIRFMFEGEEEIGSLHLREYLAHYNDLFREPDVWLICDGPVHQTRAPQLMFGVRGITSLEITVFGANRYLHSGHYGNFAPNPGLMLAQLLASMKDEQGKVLVEGYYDSVEPLSPREIEALAKVPDISDQLRREFGLGASELNNAPYAERLLLPSLNIKGIVCASVGASARNIIPMEATVAMDLRLVKGNDPRAMQDLVEAHIRKQGYHIVRQPPNEETRLSYPKIALVKRGSGYRAARSSMDQPIVDPLVRAARRASGEDVILMPSLGGSLPLYLFNEMLETPVIIVPIANHDDNQHAPDENIRLANLWYGIDLMGQILTMEP